jgi:signal transduction histidine kinase
VTNAVKHARASRVDILLELTDDVLRLPVTGDGPAA